MSRLHTITECLERKNALPPDDPEFLKKIVELMGIDTRSGGALVETLPFPAAMQRQVRRRNSRPPSSADEAMSTCLS